MCDIGQTFGDFIWSPTAPGLTAVETETNASNLSNERFGTCVTQKVAGNSSGYQK